MKKAKISKTRRKYEDEGKYRQQRKRRVPKRREMVWKEGEEGGQGKIGGKERIGGKETKTKKLGVVFCVFHIHLTPNFWAVNVFFCLFLEKDIL